MLLMIGRQSQIDKADIAVQQITRLDPLALHAIPTASRASKANAVRLNLDRGLKPSS